MLGDRSTAQRRLPGARPRPSAAAGFSLLELTVAIGVLLVSTLAAFSSQVQSFVLIESSRDAAVAMTDLEVCMEEVLTRTADEIPVAYPAGEPIPGFEGLHLNAERIVPSYPGLEEGGAAPDPLQIDLVATWNDRRNRAKTMRLTTIRIR